MTTDILHAQHNATSLVVSYTRRSLASGNVCTVRTFWVKWNNKHYSDNGSTVDGPPITDKIVCMYPSGKGPAYSGPIRGGLFIAGPFR